LSMMEGSTKWPFEVERNLSIQGGLPALLLDLFVHILHQVEPGASASLVSLLRYTDMHTTPDRLDYLLHRGLDRADGHALIKHAAGVDVVLRILTSATRNWS
jgi:hypothetical protein